MIDFKIKDLADHILCDYGDCIRNYHYGEVEMRYVWVLQEFDDDVPEVEIHGVFSSARDAQRYVIDNFGYLGDWTHITDIEMVSAPGAYSWFKISNWPVLDY